MGVAPAGLQIQRLVAGASLTYRDHEMENSEVASRREALLFAIRARLGTSRGVVLVGPPGVGKTHTLEGWAADTHAMGPVSLEGRHSSDEVVAAMSDRFGVHARAATTAGRLETLLNVLASREPRPIALDAIDDLDADARAVLTRLVRTGLSVVATSRVVHALDGFEVLDVRPLACPEVPGAAAARESPAARFFVESAQRLGALESMDERAWAHVGAIARRLEGLPLALAVTAARVRAIGLTRLAEQLERPEADSSPLAEHPRLGTTVATSLGRLEPPALALLELAAQLPDGFTLDELESFAGEPDVAGRLERLVQHSLVTARQDAATASELRYGTHAVVRRVVRAGMSPSRQAALEARHSQHLGERSLAVAAQGPAGASWVARHERALRSAFAWARAHLADPQARATGLAVATALGRLVESRGPTESLAALLDEAGTWIDADTAPALEAEIAYLRGFVRAEHIDLRAAREHLQRARALAAGGVHRHVEANATAQLAWLAARYGEVDEAFALRSAIDDSLGSQQDPWLALLVAALDTLLEANVARHDSARARAEAWRAFAVGVGDGTHESYAWGVLGCIALDQGDVPTALRQLEHSVSLADRFDARLAGAIFRGFHAVALHTSGSPSFDAYADAVARCESAKAMLYAGLFRAWGATLQIETGDDAAVQAGARILDMIRAAANWEMPQKMLGAMRGHIELAEARHARDRVTAMRHLARAARRLAATSEEDRRRMIQVRLVEQVLENQIVRALPVGPPAIGLGVGWQGRGIARDGATESLSSHPTLARLAWHLALARLVEPGRVVDTTTLRRVGWPDDDPENRGSLHRLRVAISTLRRAGFEGDLASRDGGYLLAPEAPLGLFSER